MLNSYVWTLYCHSPAGQQALSQSFPKFARIARTSGQPNWRKQLNAWINVALENQAQPADQWEQGNPVSLRELLRVWFEESDDFENDFRALLTGDGLCFDWEEDSQPGLRSWACFGGEENPLEVATCIGPVSTLLHAFQPDRFIPYYFEGNFRLFSDICRTFQISLPPLPGKLQKTERALYYLAINRALQDFRIAQAWNPQELNAFLYDFAPAYLRTEKDKELPKPQRVWFLMAGIGTEADFDLLDQATDDTESMWRGHRDARRGDIALLWCSSPRAYLHSIWRIVEDGHDDPFNNWYSLVRIGRPQSVPHLKINDLKSNPVLAASPMVRAHFQGCAGKYFRPIDYAALLKELRRRGMDIDSLPRVRMANLPRNLEAKEILNERGVEEELIEPFLNQLGFSAGRDWQRQVTVRMGRGEKVYPDYVIGLLDEPEQERAEIIVEAKFRIATQKDLTETFRQGRSYALRLQAKLLILAALEGVWLIESNNGFGLSKAIQWTWQELDQVENLALLQKLIGKSRHY